jgi:hypothetical protein
VASRSAKLNGMASHEADDRAKPLIEPDDGEPPIMWPSSGSGFEADPYSPAGTAQREWALTQGLGRSRIGKLAVWIVLGVLILGPVITLLISVLHKH